MRIVLLGPPGSGKAALSEKLADKFGMPVITVSSVMQKAAAEPSELGRLAKEAMEQSKVSDELLLALLRIQIPHMDLSKGFVLVDFPKNAGQADVLDSMLGDLGAAVELVLNLEVDPDELMERLVGRITCDNCGAQYNLYVNPPMVDGICDACGARVVRRPDDYEETISNRLRVYEGQMGPLLQYYQLSDKLHRVEADRGVDQAWKTTQKIIKALPPSAPPTSAEKALAAAPTGGAKQSATGKPKAQKPKKAVDSAKPAAKKTPVRKQAAKPTGVKKPAAKDKVAETATAKKAGADKIAAKKKATAKKGTAKKAVAKKATVKKATTKKSPPKKAVVKKAVKKTAGKKVVAKKAGAKKAAPRPAAKKAIAKKAAAKKTAVNKKAAAKRPAAKKAATKKSPAKKTLARKAPSKKPTAKKTSKKAASKRTPTRPVKKTAVKKTPAKKATPKKKVTAKAKKKGARR